LRGWTVEELRGAIDDQEKDSSTIFESKETRSREFYTFYCMLSLKSMVYIVKCMTISRFCSNILVSGKFPKTTWWVMHGRQAAHTLLAYFWVPKVELLGGKLPTARHRVLKNPIF